MTVDFPEQKNWTGVVLEMEHVTSAGLGNLLYSSHNLHYIANEQFVIFSLVLDLSTPNASVNIRIGDRVKVKPSVTTPEHNWGRNVTHKSVGVVKGKIYTFFFPK